MATASAPDPIATIVARLQRDKAPSSEVLREAGAWLDGFLTAAIIGPERVKLVELPRLLPNGDGPNSPEGEAVAVTLLGVMHGAIARELHRERAAYEPGFIDRADDTTELLKMAAEWGTGFHHGMHVRPGSWLRLVRCADSRRTMDPIARLLLAGLENREGAAAMNRDESTNAELLLEALESLGSSIWAVRDFWHRGNPSHVSSVLTAARLGRNDPCSCGSGRKLKHCCMD